MIEFVLKNAELSKMPIMIVYQKGSEITLRKIKVKRINNDIIQAYCFKKRGIRNFKRQNVLAAIKVGEIN